MAYVPIYNDNSYAGVQWQDEAAKPFAFQPIDQSFQGKSVKLWGSLPYTIQGPNDPVMQALQAWDAKIPADQLGQYFTDPRSLQIAQQVYQNTDAQNTAARNDNSLTHDAWKAFGSFLASGLGANYFLGAGAGAGAGAGDGVGLASGGGTVAGGGLAPGASPFLSGLDAGAVAGADYTGAAGLGAAGGGGMDFLTGIGDPFTGFSGDVSLADLEMGGEGGGLFGNTGGLDLSGLAGNDIPGYGSVTPGMTPQPASLGFQAGNLWDSIKQYGGSGLNALKGLLSGNASGGGTGLFGNGGGGLDTALALTPALAAIAYARNQGPLDTSRLTSSYDQFDPNALAYQYDQNTGLGRRGLESSLQRRGVMGSSFGNQDLTNFGATRDLGRQSLISAGMAQRAGIANDIFKADATDRALKNQLYGSALYSIGNIFGGSRR